MEQFRRIGEVLGSMKALMVLQDEIQINKTQCSLLLDIFTMAFDTIAMEIRQNLKLEEKNSKWKPLDQPLRELLRVFKEGEIFIRQCVDAKNWWAKAVIFHQNRDAIEFHIHNLLTYFPTVIEAIETASEIAGLDPSEMQKRSILVRKKYDMELNDPRLFQLSFGKQYLVPTEMCKRIETAWREDRWLLSQAIGDKKSSGSGAMTKTEQRLGEFLLNKLNSSEPFNWAPFHCSILTGARDYQVRHRLGNGSQFKEIHWLGESFVLRHIFGEIETLKSDISTLLALSHPNILQPLCSFCDEDRKECYLVMELMSKDLGSFIREHSSPRRRIIFSLLVAVDIMLQVARGMEYLHSQKICHGDLTPSNILLKARGGSAEGYFHVKVSGFSLSSFKNKNPRSYANHDMNMTDPFIWHAPEILAEEEQQGSDPSSKHSEKADVYSFGMICFQLLTGKIPFEEEHLQGDKMSRNIRLGERPLFPIPSPKYLVNLTKKCWHPDPALRLSFSSICRILRYTKKYLVMHPDDGQPDLHFTSLDYCDIEAGFQKKFACDENISQESVSQVPFQMFAYKVGEIEKTLLNAKGGIWKSTSEGASILKGENLSPGEDFYRPPDARSVYSDMPERRFHLMNKATYGRAIRGQVEDSLLASDLRSFCSEIPEKRSLQTPPRKPVKVRTPVIGSGTPKARDPKPLQSNAVDSAGMPKARNPKPCQSNEDSCSVKSTRITRKSSIPSVTTRKKPTQGRTRSRITDSKIS